MKIKDVFILFTALPPKLRWAALISALAIVLLLFTQTSAVVSHLASGMGSSGSGGGKEQSSIIMNKGSVADARAASFEHGASAFTQRHPDTGKDCVETADGNKTCLLDADIIAAGTKKGFFSLKP